MGHIVFGLTLFTYFISLERSCLNEVRQFEMYTLYTCMKRIINQWRFVRSYIEVASGNVVQYLLTISSYCEIDCDRS